jgi:mono/diheme cytochrome c family protein
MQVRPGSLPRVSIVAFSLVATAGLTVLAQSQPYPLIPSTRADFAPKDPIKAKAPADQEKTFVLPPGYRMELVLADPVIDTPAVIEFDGNGRMYVCEFVTYMPDVEGTNQHAPESRITRFEDTNGDGTYDTRVVFADKLVLPRMVLPLDANSILTNETASDDVVKLTDTNGDGVADKREVFYSGVGIGRDGNLEHEQSGFVWGLDNWIYSTYNSFRFRWTPTGIVREATGSNGGQWGLTQDDDGKMWFVCAGCERGPLNFQVPIQYGAYRIVDEYEPEFDIVWPIAGVGDMQGGMSRVRVPTGVVNHATATGGPDIVRGHRVPRDLVGDLLYTEPVGRLIRRAAIVKNEGLTQVRNVYPKSEFILSSDPLFRPVNIKTAPDGTVYIADMYRGIIQEGEWTRAGSYLRHKIFQYQLDKIVHLGRIWRLRFDGSPEFPAIPVGPAASKPIPSQPALPAIALDLTKPRMYDETSAQLVGHLSHANGWWRDTAQRTLVLRQDKSVVPALRTIAAATSPDTLLARFHAMWTLEGLGALDADLVRAAMKDPNPRMRIQAIRASESLFKAGDRSFDADYRAATKDADVDVALQAMLTINVLKFPDAAAIIESMMNANPARGIREIGKIALEALAKKSAIATLSPDQQVLYERGATIYRELCFSCHGDDGRGAPIAGAPAGTMMGPPIAGSPRVQGHREYVIRTIMHGLTGPLDDKTYTNVMVPMGAQTDDWVAAIASYIRNDFGNTGSYVTAADVARVRAATAGRKTPWTAAEIDKTLPILVPSDQTWRATASHNAATADRALTIIGWTSGEPQQPGMWLQIELPQATRIAEVQFNAPGGGRGNPARGAGAGPAAAAPGQVATPPAAPPVLREYQIQTSTDGTSWSQPVARGTVATITNASFAPTSAKFVRITLTAAGQNLGPLVIQNVRVFRQ